MDGYRLFRRDRPRSRGGVTAMHVREGLNCLKHDSEDDDRVDCLRVRTRGKANKTDVMMGVFYRPLN